MRIEPPPSLAWAIGNIPRGHRRRRAAARAAGRAARVPGVAADAVAAVLGGGDHAELGRVGAPAQHEAGAHERVDDQLALLARALRARRWSRSVTGQPATGVRSLIGSGTPRNGALPRRPPAGGRPSAAAARAGLVVAPDDRVQLGVALVDRGEAGVEQLDRGELARRSAAASSSAGEDGSSEGIAPTLPDGLAAWPIASAQRAPRAAAPRRATPALLRAAELHDRDREHRQPEQRDTAASTRPRHVPAPPRHAGVERVARGGADVQVGEDARRIGSTA